MMVIQNVNRGRSRVKVTDKDIEDGSRLMEVLDEQMKRDFFRALTRANSDLTAAWVLLKDQRKPFGFMLDDRGFLRPEFDVDRCW